jgi:ABC-2 type transport system permease protein
VRVVRAFFIRDLRVALSYRAPFVLDGVSVAFIMLTGAYLARLVPDATLPNFFTFLVIGLAMTALLQGAMTVVAGSFRQEQVQGTLETTLPAGLPPVRIAMGMAAYPLAHAIVRVVLYAGLAAAFGARAPGADWGTAALAAGLAGVSFAGIGLAAAGLVLIIRQAHAATAMVAALLALGAGAAFPPRFLPGWAQTLAQLSPLTHAIEVARVSLIRGYTGGAPGGRLAALAALAVASCAVGVGGLAGALALARRRGGLGEY